MIFRDPIAEPSLGRNVKDHMMEPPISNVETCGWSGKLNSWVNPAWWPDLKAILGVKNLQKLACKIRASFYIPDG